MQPRFGTAWRLLALSILGAFAGAASAAAGDDCVACHKGLTEAAQHSSHKDVACVACHADAAEHAKGQVKRPKTNNDPATCGACHADQFNAAYKTDKKEARKSKTAADGPSPNPFFNMALGGHGFTSEHAEARSHNFMLVDQMLVDRGWGGRFVPKDGWLYAAKGDGAVKAWDMLKDIWPEDNIQKARGVPGTAAAGNANCWSCKTTDPLLGWAYLGDPVPGAEFSRKSSAIDMMRASNHAYNCNFCHDPHNAKPRVVRDALIAAVTRTDFPSLYSASKNWAKLDVQDVGVRGFTRKIAYLDKPDAKLMCAQCHVEYVCNPGHDPKTGKAVGFDSGLTNVFPFVQTDKLEEYYSQISFADFKHPLTGASLIKMQHPDTEHYIGSVHEKAGLDCAACHMPKIQKDGKTVTVHQATSPRNYLKETCLTCHADKDEAGMNKVIDAMHNHYVGKLRNAEQRMTEMFTSFEIAKAVGVSEEVLAEARKLHATAHANWEWNTAANGSWFHNHELAVKQLDTAAKSAIKARDLLRKAASDKGKPAAAPAAK